VFSANGSGTTFPINEEISGLFNHPSPRYNRGHSRGNSFMKLDSMGNQSEAYAYTSPVSSPRKQYSSSDAGESMPISPEKFELLVNKFETMIRRNSMSSFVTSPPRATGIITHTDDVTEDGSDCDSVENDIG